MTAVLLLCACASAQVAGKVDKVLPAGFLTHEKNVAEAKPADPVSWNDIARTNDKGRMRLALADGSLLTLGSKAEMRVVKHDSNTQQTTLELLYGSMRTKVAPLTKPDSSFQVHTPTAVIGAIGTEAVIVSTETTTISQNITSEQIQNLPTGTRNFNDLSQLTPGATPGNSNGGQSIADFARTGETDVYSLDHVVGVRNIDPAVKGTVYVSPGQMTIVRPGQPPTPPVPFDFIGVMPLSSRNAFQDAMNDFGCSSDFVIDGKIVSSSDPSRIGKMLDYSILGRGTGSTGNVLRAKFNNLTGCNMNVLLHAGSVLQPFSFTGGMKGITHNNYQVMLTFGGFWSVPPSMPPPPPPPPAMFFAPPENGEPETVLQGYCLERTKLAPHPATAYKFADPQLQSQFAGYQKFVDKAHELFLNGQMQSTVPLDLVIQWAIWIDEDKMNEKAFRDAHWKIVEKAMQEEHRKIDKEVKARVEASQNDIWPNAQRLIAAVR